MCVNPKDDRTISMFPANRPILMLGECGSARTASSPPHSLCDELMENRLRNINGPQFASLGVWDGT